MPPEKKYDAACSMVWNCRKTLPEDLALLYFDINPIFTTNCINKLLLKSRIVVSYRSLLLKSPTEVSYCSLLLKPPTEDFCWFGIGLIFYGYFMSRTEDSYRSLLLKSRTEDSCWRLYIWYGYKNIYKICIHVAKSFCLKSPTEDLCYTNKEIEKSL